MSGLDIEKAWHPASGQYRLAHSLLQGMTELNTLFPNRSQGPQEGSVGDLAHQAEGSGSDHNPNVAGVVRAWDIDVTGNDFDPHVLANYLQALMAKHFKMFGMFGYVIFDHHITGWSPWAQWQLYTEHDPHTEHIHVSVGRDSSEYDDMTPWNLASAFQTPVVPTHPHSVSKFLTDGAQPMLLQNSKTKVAMYVLAKGAVFVQTADYNSLKAAGVPTAEISDDLFGKIAALQGGAR